jgi:transcriptional regulator with XRE-family HTH domain
MPIKAKPRREGTSLAQMAAEITDSELYDIESARFLISAAIAALMHAQGINKAALAARLGTSRAYVTKMLQGNGNFTIETLVKIARALKMKFRPVFEPKAAGSKLHLDRPWSPITVPSDPQTSRTAGSATPIADAKTLRLAHASKRRSLALRTSANNSKKRPVQKRTAIKTK